MNTEEIIHYLTIALSLITIGTVLFKAGRWSRDIEASNKHYHEIRNVLNALPMHYIGKEIYLRDLREASEHRGRLEGKLDTIEKQQTQILVAFGKAGGSLV